METDPIHVLRGRYVRTLLAWHGKSRADLAAKLGLTVNSVYKRLDGRRPFTTQDLLKIADWLKVDPGLLLRPPELVDALGIPVISVSGSAWTRRSAGQRHLRSAA